MTTDCHLPDQSSTWRDWHVPISCDSASLQVVLDSAGHMAAEQEDIPLIIQLVENPKFDLPWIDVFKGAVNLEDHDCIHALLGRGMLPKDEAFVIGFTMGSTNRTTDTEERLFSLISKYLYPGPYKFSDEDLEVFRDAIRLGYISDCEPLDKVDYSQYLKLPLGEVRRVLNIETDLIMAYYRIEQRRYPHSPESQRLLPVEE